MGNPERMKIGDAGNKLLEATPDFIQSVISVLNEMVQIMLAIFHDFKKVATVHHQIKRFNDVWVVKHGTWCV
jgi:hypothetical protein